MCIGKLASTFFAYAFLSAHAAAADGFCEAGTINRMLGEIHAIQDDDPLAMPHYLDALAYAGRYTELDDFLRSKDASVYDLALRLSQNGQLSEMPTRVSLTKIAKNAWRISRSDEEQLAVSLAFVKSHMPFNEIDQLVDMIGAMDLTPQSRVDAIRVLQLLGRGDLAKQLADSAPNDVRDVAGAPIQAALFVKGSKVEGSNEIVSAIRAVEDPIEQAYAGLYQAEYSASRGWMSEAQRVAMEIRRPGARARALTEAIKIGLSNASLRHFHALELLRAAEAAFDEDENNPRLAKLLTLSDAARRIGDREQTINYLREADDLLRSSPDAMDFASWHASAYISTVCDYGSELFAAMSPVQRASILAMAVGSIAQSRDLGRGLGRPEDRVDPSVLARCSADVNKSCLVELGRQYASSAGEHDPDRMLALYAEMIAGNRDAVDLIRVASASGGVSAVDLAYVATKTGQLAWANEWIRSVDSEVPVYGPRRKRLEDAVSILIEIELKGDRKGRQLMRTVSHLLSAIGQIGMGGMWEGITGETRLKIMNMMIDTDHADLVGLVYGGHEWGRSDLTGEAYMLIHGVEADLNKEPSELIEEAKNKGFVGINLDRYLTVVARRLAAAGQVSKALEILRGGRSMPYAKALTTIGRNPRLDLTADERASALGRARDAIAESRTIDATLLRLEIGAGLAEAGQAPEGEQLVKANVSPLIGIPDYTTTAIAAVSAAGLPELALQLLVINDVTDFGEGLAAVASGVEEP